MLAPTSGPFLEFDGITTRNYGVVKVIDNETHTRLALIFFAYNGAFHFKVVFGNQAGLMPCSQ